MTALTVALPGGDTLLCHVPSRLEQQFGYQEATAVLVGWQAQDASCVAGVRGAGRQGGLALRAKTHCQRVEEIASHAVASDFFGHAVDDRPYRRGVCVVCTLPRLSAQGTRWEHYMAEGAKAYQNGQETNAEMFYLAALEDVQNAGPEDPRLAATLNTLAVLYHSQRKYAQAEPLYQRVLKLLEQTIGPDHPTLATTR